MNRYASYALTTIFLACTAGISFANEANSEKISLDGMERVDKDSRGEIYADPGIDWTVYDSVMLDDATVAFRKHWRRDQNRSISFKVSNEDMERIKTDLATLFNEVFVEELTSDNGYRITEQPGENVMRITPRIVDLDVYAPDTAKATGNRSYSESAGRMTLKLEIYDSKTGDLISAASDRQEAPRLGIAEWRTSASNNAEARRMLKRWATGLRTRLDESRGVTLPGS